MRDLLPKGEELRRAVKWISDSLTAEPDQPIGKFVQEAIFRFNLSPLDADFLLGIFTGREEEN